MKFRNQARLYLAVFEFEAHYAYLAYAQLFKVPDYRYEKYLTPMWRQRVNLFLVICIDFLT